MSTLQQQSAQSLAARSLTAESQSESTLLIEAAIRQDPTIAAHSDDLRAIWIKRWLKKNANRAKEG